MEWLLPAGAWAFSGLAVVIALYILRRKATQHEVPSLLLWRQTQSAREASRPFQKLRKQWLLFLQLLCVALLAFSLLRPALVGGVHGELAFIVDVSASMQATRQGKTRLDLAVQDAMAMVDGMQEGDAVTVLTAGSTVGQAITRSPDKQKIKAALRALKPENGTADMDGAVSLAQAMRRDIPELSIIVYSDSYAAQNGDVEVRPVGAGADNRSVLSLSCTPQESGMAAFARIMNYGAACEVTVECYADGALCDIRTLSLEEGAPQSVQFSVPQEAQIVWTQIVTGDAIAADNTRYWVNQKATERRVLLVTEGNVFLEKALALRGDLVVLKTTAADAVSLEGFDLYILDGTCPEPLPESGALLAFAPTADILGIHPEGAQTTAGMLRMSTGALAEAIAKNMLLSEISLRTYHPLTGGEPVLTWDGKPLLSVASQGNRRGAVAGFDLHDSNLPMKADFPILVQNLLEYLLPDAVIAVENAACGTALEIALDDRTTEAGVVTPSGRTVRPEGNQLTDTGEIGVYTLTEKRVGLEPRMTLFALHMADAESDVRQVAAPQGAQATQTGQRGRGMELTIFFLLGLLALSLVEWEVSRRGA